VTGEPRAAPARALVVGLGHADRGDDAVGAAVASRARELMPPGVDVVQHEDPASLIDLWSGSDLVVVSDAVRSGKPPGTVCVLDAGTGPLRIGTGAGGTHEFGLAEAVELARALDRLPPKLVIVGIEAEQFKLGAPLSPPVAAAVGKAARNVAEVIRKAQQ
jgi:hydrogenase maturation protease